MEANLLIFNIILFIWLLMELIERINLYPSSMLISKSLYFLSICGDPFTVKKYDSDFEQIELRFRSLVYY